jgi:hypothetical protein
VSRTKDLSAVYLKLERANKHIQTLRDEVATFRERDPEAFGFRAEKTAAPDKSIRYDLYAIVREKPPRELALTVGDAIQSIRSALEYLVYELAPPRVRSKRNTQFPIFDDECEFKVRSPPMLKGLSSDERAVIQRVQPYAATDIPGNDPLAILGKLSNRDKHRLLITMIAALSETASWVASDNADIRFTHLAPGPVDHDTKIVSFIATPKDPAQDMKVHPMSGLEIQVGGTGIVGYRIGAVELVEMIHHHVRHHVLEMWFERGVMPMTWAEVQAAQSPK